MRRSYSNKVQDKDTDLSCIPECKIPKRKSILTCPMLYALCKLRWNGPWRRDAGRVLWSKACIPSGSAHGMSAAAICDPAWHPSALHLERWLGRERHVSERGGFAGWQNGKFLVCRHNGVRYRAFIFGRRREAGGAFTGADIWSRRWLFLSSPMRNAIMKVLKYFGSQ